MNIKVSEMFYSIQGESVTAGIPAVFVRLSGCNLYCDGEWICDTLNVWKTGIDYEINALKKKIDNLLSATNPTNTHLVFTGGEPLLRQDELSELIEKFDNLKFIEVETNGTIIPDIICDMVDLFNVSPKLPNSGNRESKFYNPAAIDWLVENTNMIFKFVISKEQDIDDIHKYYGDHIKQLGAFRTYLMPACETRDEYNITAPITAELCKKYGYCFSNRLQINIWNKKTGV